MPVASTPYVVLRLQWYPCLQLALAPITWKSQRLAGAIPFAAFKTSRSREATRKSTDLLHWSGDAKLFYWFWCPVGNGSSVSGCVQLLHYYLVATSPIGQTLSTGLLLFDDIDSCSLANICIGPFFSLFHRTF